MIAAPIMKPGSGFGEIHWTSSPDGRRTGIPWQIPLWQMFLKFPTVGHPHGGVLNRRCCEIGAIIRRTLAGC